MSTNVTIAVKMNDEEIKQVYLHFDGDKAGTILKKYYNTQELAEKVVSLGNLSVLDKLMDCPKGHSFKTPIEGYSIAYERDRGDKGTEIYNCFSETKIRYNQYIYFWDGERWIVKHYFNIKRISENKEK